MKEGTKHNKSCTWGIIGCGDVAEVKSGPAFQLCEHSQLYAVMRRTGEKAKDFAKRHKVPVWHDKVFGILNEEKVNSVYIATPPASHLQYAIEALKAEKDVYLEKPMVISKEEAYKLKEAVSKTSKKLVVAHYRRQLPMFKKLKELIDFKTIGDVEFIDLKYLKQHKDDSNWRLNPIISGGGHFHDIAPHQIDIMLYFFGSPKESYGKTVKKETGKSDTVSGHINFKNDIHFKGIWCFNLPEFAENDQCKIYGTKGTITFSFFGNEIAVKTTNNKEILRFEHPKHIQQPFIQETVDYFLGERDNPCSVEEGVIVNEIMDAFTKP